MFPDYLGQALIIEHDDVPRQDGTLVSIYAHTKPLDHIRPGCQVIEGKIIATIADNRRTKANIFPYLHYTIGSRVCGYGIRWFHLE